MDYKHIIDTEDVNTLDYLFSEYRTLMDTATVNTYPLIHYVAKKGNVRILKQLLHYGMDINLVDQYDTTPLSIACDYGKFDSVKFLLDHNANVSEIGSVKVNYLTYVNHYEGDIPIFRLLLSQKHINLNLPNKKMGQTILMVLISTYLYENINNKFKLACIKMLLWDRRTDLNVKDKNGFTYSDYISQCYYRHINKLYSPNSMNKIQQIKQLRKIINDALKLQFTLLGLCVHYVSNNDSFNKTALPKDIRNLLY